MTAIGVIGRVTRDVGRVHRVAAAVHAGTFWINSTINAASPFGGYNMSGHGRSSGVEALYEYTRAKSVWVETAAEPAVAFGYAPGIRGLTVRVKGSYKVVVGPLASEVACARGAGAGLEGLRECRAISMPGAPPPQIRKRRGCT